MNEVSIVRFLEALAGSEDLASAMREAVGHRSGSDADRAIAGFAQQRGYDLDVADVARVRQACVEARERAVREGGGRDLADAELDGVDGGLIAESLLIGGLVALVPAIGLSIFAGVLMQEQAPGWGNLTPKPLVP